MAIPWCLPCLFCKVKGGGLYTPPHTISAKNQNECMDKILKAIRQENEGFL